MIRKDNYKLWRISLTIFLLVSITPHCVDTSMRPPSPLIYRIMKADYIVIGRLIDVEKQAICVEHQDFIDGKPARFYLDKGTILATRRLFPVNPAQQNLPQEETVSLPFVSHSRSHPQGDGNFRRSSAHFYFDEGDEGIWLLKREVFVDHFGVVRPDNLLPIDSLKAVESAISEVMKFVSEQKKKEKESR